MVYDESKFFIIKNDFLNDGSEINIEVEISASDAIFRQIAPTLQNLRLISKWSFSFCC
jgi:hypothetical protein